MSAQVLISATATWTPGGVSFGAPALGGEGRALARWPEAPELSRIHPRARRPNGAAKALVQLAHALLGERDSRGRAPERAAIGLAVGSVSGCSAADVDFDAGLVSRGLAFGSPAVFVYTLPTAAPGEVSIALGLKGGLVTVSAGRVSGLAAVALGAARVAEGRCAACLCGAYELPPPQGGGPEAISLFLLEAAASDPGGQPAPARLVSWRSGFGAPPSGPLAAEDPLHALARAVAGAGEAPSLVTSVGPEGHWVSVTVDRTARLRAEGS